MRRAGKQHRDKCKCQQGGASSLLRRALAAGPPSLMRAHHASLHGAVSPRILDHEKWWIRLYYNWAQRSCNQLPVRGSASERCQTATSLQCTPLLLPLLLLVHCVDFTPASLSSQRARTACGSRRPSAAAPPGSPAVPAGACPPAAGSAGLQWGGGGGKGGTWLGGRLGRASAVAGSLPASMQTPHLHAPTTHQSAPTNQPVPPPTNHDVAGQVPVELLLVVYHVHKAVADAKLHVQVGEVGGDASAQALHSRRTAGQGRAGQRVRHVMRQQRWSSYGGGTGHAPGLALPNRTHTSHIAPPTATAHNRPTTSPCPLHYTSLPTTTHPPTHPPTHPLPSHTPTFVFVSMKRLAWCCAHSLVASSMALRKNMGARPAAAGRGREQG